ncbi:MAG: hypothetical protein O2923_08895 [Verrucomicrobia bacterium]|nr:hypothetical protein [Verrucomicrobiota bacterium]MDA1087894.1 hypothetical protein [Verrucomicrobiota bacterium]
MTGGVNYGWNCLEALSPVSTNGCTLAALTSPVHAYSHGVGCSVTGGVVSRKTPWSNLYGTYLYGDWCTGRIWGLRPCGGSWTNRQLLVNPGNIGSFGEDRFGNVYVVENTSGIIRRIDEVQTDLDADGQADAWEIFYGLSTNDVDDASADLDGDRVSNGDEFIAGSDPTDPDDFPVIRIARDSPVTLTWPAVVDREYDVEVSATLATNSWSGLYTNIPGENAELLRTDTNAATPSYYRLQIRIP